MIVQNEQSCTVNASMTALLFSPQKLLTYQFDPLLFSKPKNISALASLYFACSLRDSILSLYLYVVTSTYPSPKAATWSPL